ncbi:ABC transporter ATP-binding protein [Lacrimispora amygdalina]|uniref:Nickel import system ATP-binding protein NikD n=1 Tax=Lacrimispora amygdalina TaxID=253257 RepID=A0ABQ5M7J6_9FIRM
MPVLKIENLNVRYDRESRKDAVHQVSLSLKEGECVGLIGESGSGKSTIALAIMGLLHKRTEVKGNIWFENKNLLELSDRDMESVRWDRIAIVYQNGLDVLNPVISVGEQIAEAIICHTGMQKEYAREKASDMLVKTGLETFWYDAYPHQLSGGMRQKVLIAMALSCNPDILIADEPTMALDIPAKNEIISLLKNMQKKEGFSLLVISHELPVISALADSVAVMYMGNILEKADTKELLSDPLHPYTRGLIYSSPAILPMRDMWGIPGEIVIHSENQCPFYSRCNQRVEQCLNENPPLRVRSDGRKVACLRGGIVTLLEGNGLNKSYKSGKRELKVCSGCNIRIRSGEVAALIGKSGSGKTTLAQILSGIIFPDSGIVRFEGRAVLGNSESGKKHGIQIVFQDPFSATNEQFTVREIVQEGLDIIKSGSQSERREQVTEALLKVGLPYDEGFLSRKGHTLSGGQRQRVAVARALVMEPKLLIADEISSMLDPSSAANLMRLLKEIQNRSGFSMLYITHDIALAQKISDYVYIMKKGKIVEHGNAGEIFTNPKENETKNLIEAISIRQ